MTGTIRTLRVDKGFGFIKDEQGKEYFFHQSAVYGEGIDNLREGDSVEFEVGEGPKGPRAETCGVRPPSPQSDFPPTSATPTTALGRSNRRRPAASPLRTGERCARPTLPIAGAAVSSARAALKFGHAFRTTHGERHRNTTKGWF